MENNSLSEIEFADINKTTFSIFPSFNIEKILIKKGYKIIAGIDEAGRGSLAGPLAVGLVIYSMPFILKPAKDIENFVKDSKKLTGKKRTHALELIEKHSSISAITLVSHKLIDKINVNKATEFAINKLLNKIPVTPDLAIIDGNFSFKLEVPYISIPRGDSKSISIASASIIAKVKRDQILERLDPIYPEFDMKNNKGYGTKKHIDSIQKVGFSPIHRLSYEPVKSIISSQEGIVD